MALATIFDYAISSLKISVKLTKLLLSLSMAVHA